MKMKSYTEPKMDIIELKEADIIATSGGVNTPTIDEDAPIWDLNI